MLCIFAKRGSNGQLHDRLYAIAVVLLVGALSPVHGHHLHTSPKPDWQNYAAVARWLVHSNDWGTLSTISQNLKADHPVAFGNAVSFSDGPRDRSTGRLFFYLTIMDASAQDLQANPWATLTVAEAQLPHACSGVDPEDPTCAKVSISGRMGIVRGHALPEAERLLFSRHPAMRTWPKGHNFHIYELDIEHIRLLDFYGGANDIDPQEYFAVNIETMGRDAAGLKGAGTHYTAQVTKK